MCLHHPGRLFTIFYVHLYSIAQQFTFFMAFCHEIKVWYWVLFDIPPLSEILETATFGVITISMLLSWYLLIRVRYPW